MGGPSILSNDFFDMSAASKRVLCCSASTVLARVRCRCRAMAAENAIQLPRPLVLEANRVDGRATSVCDARARH